MSLIYVGDSGRVNGRVADGHCNGNVEGSSCRKHVARAMGFTIQNAGRRKKITCPENGEEIVSAYLRSGYWQCASCRNPNEAKSFQFFLIQRRKPLLNKDIGKWEQSNRERYEQLLDQWAQAKHVKCAEKTQMPSESGVYGFFHDQGPLEFVTQSHKGLLVGGSQTAANDRTSAKPNAGKATELPIIGSGGCTPPAAPAIYGNGLYSVGRDPNNPHGILILVTHANKDLRACIAQHSDEGRYWLSRLESFRISTISAKRKLAGVMTDYYGCFFNALVRFELR